MAIETTPKAKETPVSVSLLRLFAVCCALCIAATAAIVYLNRSTAMVTGKVVDRSSETVFASRKSSYQQEVVTVAYTINGVERAAQTPLPRHGGGSSLVPVRYYPAMPFIPWFYTKSNPYLLYCILALLVSLSGLILSWVPARKAQATRKSSR